ncbi:efflux RND transporter periplasmic adaptor subunit [Oecophyllibacter saccharovorans]|uniref:Efflux RND transporter periplasmic adaptor subunit n=1 Tax=Oecophyllibacter saccharovorans TaxID=2558360 RepID=A0A506URE7_9PROT|nr:efflux RND transporter periplasmic adaptor subunit [Oecophyllibacter saccharovorans]TPW35920.1 efflux RND transporter periplasmic adaptor subunit [Oecophyllibacter saccharovorans]
MTTPSPASAPSMPEHEKTRRHPVAFTLVLLGLLLGLIILWRLLPHKKATGTGHAAQAVAVAEVAAGDIPVIYQLLGTVVPIANVTITPRVNGYIARIEYQEGQHVNAGDELELIDPRPYEAALTQAQGALAADRAQLEKARIDNGRYQRLLTQNSTAAMTAKDQQLLVKQLEGQVKSDEGNVRTAQLNLMYCHIIAPVTGRIGIRALDLGNYVTIGQSGGLAVLTQMQPISVIFTLPQNTLPGVWDEIRQHDVLTVEAWDSDNLQRLATGTVRALDSQINTATGTVRLRGIFPNKTEELFPNEFVNAHLHVKTLKHVLLVPGISVQVGPNGTFTYVVDKDLRVRVQPVKTGYANDTQTVILSGLKAGDKVVTDGISHLKPGAKVTIVARDRSTPSAL